jgi:hypothetical protein
MSWTLISRTGSWGHYRASAPATDMPNLKPGDWKVMADQAFIRKDNAGTIAGVTPNVDDINPRIGVANVTNAVTLNGKNFTGATGVTFGGTAATLVTVVNNNQLTCTLPAKAAGAYLVVVTTPTGSSPGFNYGVF